MTAIDRDTLYRVLRMAQDHSLVIRTLSLIVSPALLSVWIGLVRPADVGQVLFWGFIGLIAALQLVTFFLVERNTTAALPDLATAYQDVLAENHDLRSALGQLEKDRWKADYCNLIGHSWATIQTHLGIRQEPGPGNITNICENILAPLITSADKIFGWNYDDLWTVTVYQWSDAKQLLVPVWWSRSRGHPASGTPRCWQNGEGHCGSAFMSQRILFTTELLEAGTFNRVLPSQTNIRDYDRMAYRSFATAPLTACLTDADGSSAIHALGVVTLTSNRPGRFAESNLLIIQQLGQVLTLALWQDRLANPESPPTLWDDIEEKADVRASSLTAG